MLYVRWGLPVEGFTVYCFNVGGLFIPGFRGYWFEVDAVLKVQGSGFRASGFSEGCQGTIQLLGGIRHALVDH